MKDKVKSVELVAACGGDRSVGIPSFIENIRIVSDTGFTLDEIEIIKEFFNELYDIGRNGGVYLKSEWAAQVEAENDHYKDMYERRIMKRGL